MRRKHFCWKHQIMRFVLWRVWLFMSLFYESDIIKIKVQYFLSFSNYKTLKKSIHIWCIYKLYVSGDIRRIQIYSHPWIGLSLKKGNYKGEKEERDKNSCRKNIHTYIESIKIRHRLFRLLETVRRLTID